MLQGLNFPLLKRLSKAQFQDTNVNWCLIHQLKLDSWVSMTLGFWFLGYWWTLNFEGGANEDWTLDFEGANKDWTVVFFMVVNEDWTLAFKIPMKVGLWFWWCKWKLDCGLFSFWKWSLDFGLCKGFNFPTFWILIILWS